MKLAVLFSQRAVALVRDQRGILIAQRRQQGHLGFRGKLRRQARGRALEDFAHHVEFADHRMVELGHHEAALSVVAGQSIGLQARQSLAHRGARQTQRRGQVDLAQAIAGAKAPLADGAADFLIRVLAALQPAGRGF